MVGVRKKKIPKIIFPLWSQCASMSLDPFWIELYTQASYGKTPKGFGYSNGLLEFNKGQKTFQTSIPQDPSGALEVSQEFFRSHGVMSEIDVAIMAKEDIIVEDGWKQVDDIVKGGKKKAQFAEYILREFSKKFCDDNNITYPGAPKELFNVLFLAYKSSCLNDVLIQDAKIVSINNLTAQDGRFYYASHYPPKQNKNKLNPIIEILGTTFDIRDKSTVNIPKAWGNWNVNRHTELGNKIEFVTTSAHNTSATDTD